LHCFEKECLLLFGVLENDKTVGMLVDSGLHRDCLMFCKSLGNDSQGLPPCGGTAHGPSALSRVHLGASPPLRTVDTHPAGY